MFLSDQSVPYPSTALLADEGVCEQVAKAAIDYAAEVLNEGPNGAPTPWQLNYICVIEDAIIHHIDWALETKASIGELEQCLKLFIDQLGQIFQSSHGPKATKVGAVIH